VNLSSESTPQREGLPTSYQMRADAHYVDELDRADSNATLRYLAPNRVLVKERGEAAPAFVESVKRHGVLQPLLVRREGAEYRLIDGRRRLAAALAAGAPTVPCLVHDVDADAAAALAEALKPEPDAAAAGDSRSGPPTAVVERAAHELTRSLAQLSSCAALLEHTDITQKTLTDIVRVEAARAWCLATLVPVVASGRAREHQTVRYPVRRILDRVSALGEHERRLRGLVLDSRNGVGDGIELAVNADMIVAAVAGLLLSAFELCGDQPGARFEMASAARGSDFCVVSVVGPRAAGRGVPGGFAEFMLEAAGTTAAMFGGRLVSAARDGGTIYTIQFSLSS